MRSTMSVASFQQQLASPYLDPTPAKQQSFNAYKPISIVNKPITSDDKFTERLSAFLQPNSSNLVPSRSYFGSQPMIRPEPTNSIIGRQQQEEDQFVALTNIDSNHHNRPLSAMDERGQNRQK